MFVGRGSREGKFGPHSLEIVPHGEYRKGSNQEGAVDQGLLFQRISKQPGE